MNELTVINEQKVLGKDFKVYGTFEEPLFLAKDVAEWIEHSDVSKMVQSIDEDEKLTRTMFVSGQNREVWLLTENGLYEVLFQSRKPIAKEFKKQVKTILHTLRTTGKAGASSMSEKEIEVMDKRVSLDRANFYRELADKYSGRSETWGQILDAYATKEIAGEFLLPLPKAKKTLSAGEVGKLLGVTANKIGSIAIKNNLKTGQYGEWVHDKSRYSNKEVEVFRYYEDSVSTFRELLK